MTFLERLDSLMAEKSLTRASLARLSDVPYTTIDGFYKKGYENAKISTIRKIAHALGVSLDYLIEEEPIETKKAPSMSDEAKELLPLFESLDQLDRVRVIGTVTGLLMGEKYQQDIEKSKNA